MLLSDGRAEGKPGRGAADLPDEERHFFLNDVGALEHDVMRAACGDDAPTARGEVGEIVLHAAPCIHHGPGLVVGQGSRRVAGKHKDGQVAESGVDGLVAGAVEALNLTEQARDDHVTAAFCSKRCNVGWDVTGALLAMAQPAGNT